MRITNKDYKLLCDIELYLQKHNNKLFVSKEDKKLYKELCKLNKKLEHLRKERNKKVWETIKAKRETNINYGRPQREGKKVEMKEESDN